MFTFILICFMLIFMLSMTMFFHNVADMLHICAYLLMVRFFYDSI